MWIKERMKQIIQSRKTGKLSIKDVPNPTVEPGYLLVRTTASLISAGTERQEIIFAKKNLVAKAKARPDLVKKVLRKVNKDGLRQTFQSVMARLDEPLPLGYSATGDVIALGEGLEGQFRVGERVSMAGSGIANHAEINSVPANLSSSIPDSVSNEEACFGTVSSIALHAVRNLRLGIGDTISVIGMGLIGQLAAQLIRLSGSRVVAIDYNESRLKLAMSLGAEFSINLSRSNPTEEMAKFTAANGCDGILIAAATKSNEPFQTAADIARDRARVTMVGMTGTNFPYADFMKKELNIIVSRSYGPGRYDSDFEQEGVKYPAGWIRWTETENLRECLRLMGEKNERQLKVAPLISHQFPLAKSEDAYSMILNSTEPHLGVVLSYKGKTIEKQPTSIKTRTTKKNKKCVLGVIGAGNYARTVLLPLLKQHKQVTLHTVVTKKGASANYSKETFGFENASTDPEQVISNPEINSVLIATRHSSHANLTLRALSAGKNVFVEKPLALNQIELNKIIVAKRKSENIFFQVGFNRRFAPMAIKTKQELIKSPAPRFMTFRINAGKIPTNHWIHNPKEGGGRILGELCHFIDLARFFASAPISSVYGEASEIKKQLCENVTASLSFANGSLANLLYTANGDDSREKENYEIFLEGKNFKISDFRKLEITGHGKSFVKRDQQNKGLKESIYSFVDVITKKDSIPVDENEIIDSSSGTLAVLESIRNGKRIIF